MIYLETPRLILRDYREEDFEQYYTLKSDAKTMYYLQDIQLHSRKEAEEDFCAVLDDMRRPDRTMYFFHIEEKLMHRMVGSIGYTVTGRTPLGNLVHAGYFTLPQFWGNGYVTEALRRVLSFAFRQGNVYRVTTGCLAENVGSEKVMIKSGLIKEAVHVDWEYHDGKMKTRLEYRLLRREWEEMNLEEEPLCR